VRLIPLFLLSVACSGGGVDDPVSESVDPSPPLTDPTWTNHLRPTDGEICLRAFNECSSLCF